MSCKKTIIPIIFIAIIAILSALISPTYPRTDEYRFLSSKGGQIYFMHDIFFVYLPLIILSSLLLFGLSRKLRFEKADLSYTGLAGSTLVFLLITARNIFGSLFSYSSVRRITALLPDAIVIILFILPVCIISIVAIKYIYREKWKKAIISGVVFGTVSILLYAYVFTMIMYLLHGFPG